MAPAPRSVATKGVCHSPDEILLLFQLASNFFIPLFLLSLSRMPEGVLGVGENASCFLYSISHQDIYGINLPRHYYSLHSVKG
ncbi:hypothetical protein O3P69_001342 [Scylla paramamosain]|uniref:Uncharacterized protein n=1 Tax=Scylla paramamosain TaxID=85552 RepID=A0AAW0UTZ9_SCYPA